MNNRAGFTLLEVLFAVVLLALVVSVCVPIMRPTQPEATTDITAFSYAFDEAIFKTTLSSSLPPTLDQFNEAAISIGGRCEPLGEINEDLYGQWISITNGTDTILRWMRVPQNTPAVIP